MACWTSSAKVLGFHFLAFFS